MRDTLRYLLIFCLLGLFFCDPLQARTWTDRSGKQIKATFVRIHEGQVVLKRGQQIAMIPLQNFSDGDLDYLKPELKKAGFHIWQDVHGKHVVANFLDFREGQVTLKLLNGSPNSVDFNDLIESDQDLVRTKLVAAGRDGDVEKYYAQVAALEERKRKEKEKELAQKQLAAAAKKPTPKPAPAAPPVVRSDKPSISEVPQWAKPPSMYDFNPGSRVVTECGKCKKRIQIKMDPGDRCPYCHTIMYQIENEDGTVDRASFFHPNIIIAISIPVGIFFLRWFFRR